VVDTGWAIRKGIAILNKGLMKKATAIDWLVEQMFGEHTRAWQKQIDQAKQMEKAQIVEAHGHKYCAMEDEVMTGEEYYNKTYNT